jgi:predicted amidohydrolase YtcJ
MVVGRSIQNAPTNGLDVLEAAPKLALDAITHKSRTIEVGKQADLVILASNPLRSDPTLLAEIDIKETFSRGLSVYNAPAD